MPCPKPEQKKGNQMTQQLSLKQRPSIEGVS